MTYNTKNWKRKNTNEFSLVGLTARQYENRENDQSEREKVFSGFRFNVSFVDCTSVLLNLSLRRRLV